MSSTDIGLASGWCFLIYSSTNYLEQEFQTQWMTRGYALWFSWWIWRWKWSRKNRGLQSYYEVHFCRHKCIKTGRSWQVSSEDGKVTIPPLPPWITDVMFIIELLTNIQRVLALSNCLKRGLCQLVYAQIAEDKALKSTKLYLS